jgi:hypothetical protein
MNPLTLHDQYILTLLPKSSKDGTQDLPAGEFVKVLRAACPETAQKLHTLPTYPALLISSIHPFLLDP